MASGAYAFIDASNLFYGGESSLGWQIDYQKLAGFLHSTLGCKRIFYYAGVRLCGFQYDFLSGNDFPLDEYCGYLERQSQDTFLEKQLARAKFLKKLKGFGYELKLKPAREIRTENGLIIKANCDVDLTFDAMLHEAEYTKVVLMTGDGDFLVLMKYFFQKKEQLTVIARANRTAKEIKQLMKSKFFALETLRSVIEKNERETLRSSLSRSSKI